MNLVRVREPLRELAVRDAERHFLALEEGAAGGEHEFLAPRVPLKRLRASAVDLGRQRTRRRTGLAFAAVALNSARPRARTGE